jgi:competence protein ComEC
MRCAILGFTAGVLILQCSASLPAQATLASTTTFAFCLLFLAHAVVKQPSALRVTAAGMMRMAAGFVLGHAWAALLAQAALAPSLNPANEGTDIVIEGIVTGLPYRFPQGERFDLAVERSLDPRVTLPPKITLSWYANLRGMTAPVADLLPGERWRLTVRLQRPHGNANPGGFDYEVWLLEQGVRATVYVRPDPGNVRLSPFVASAGAIIGRARAFLRGRIEHALEGKPYAPVIVALVIGDQRGIAQSDWQVFNRTGIGHLISISGLRESVQRAQGDEST